MEVTFHRSFLKLYEKVPSKIQSKFEERLALFHENPFDDLLRNHSLSGEWAGFRSINITGDYRAIYEVVGENAAKFYAIGTHGKLYK
jgi:addiction module RelE/StbE family toxin